jgi:catechol 2,3-dioxygenase-like lactoylglutathione lyase family enzyme
MAIHFAIPTQDLDKSRDFYEQLGFRYMSKWDKPDQDLSAYWLEFDESVRIELAHKPGFEYRQPENIPELSHLALPVESLKDEIDKWQDRGVKILKPITKGVSVKQFAFIEDPSGFPVELVEY